MSRLLLLVPLVTGCVTRQTTSNPGSFLTAVRVVDHRVVTTRCDASYTYTRTFNPLASTNEGHRTQLDVDGCRTEAVTFPETQVALPAHCWPSVEPWLLVPASHREERAARWAVIPADCQALLAGGRS